MDAPRKRAIKKIIFCFFFGVTAFTNIALFCNAIYLDGSMPREPHPDAGRIYPTTASRCVTVYVTRRERQWSDFLNYTLFPIEGLGIVVLGVVFLIREHKGLPPIKGISRLWND